MRALLALVAVLGGGTFTNPVLNRDFPDPFVLKVGKTYYAYATQGNGKQVQTATSPDLVHWKLGPDALPHVAPKWGYNGATWAPEVMRFGAHRYVLYYTTSQRIGRAVARSPLGPFRDDSKVPLVNQLTLGGSIDASPFRDRDGKLYLVWKNDGNSVNLPTSIWSQRLTADGLRLVGRPTKLVSNDQVWEGRVVEGPTMWLHDGAYYLFYSGNDYASNEYAVGYATCDGPLGPCTQAPENPILTTACRALGPGHNALLQVGDQTWIVYHAWNAARTARVLWIDRLDWVDGKPVVRGPTCTPQPDP